jgi:hypothetical protein
MFREKGEILTVEPIQRRQSLLFVAPPEVLALQCPGIKQIAYIDAISTKRSAVTSTKTKSVTPLSITPE